MNDNYNYPKKHEILSIVERLNLAVYARFFKEIFENNFTADSTYTMHILSL